MKMNFLKRVQDLCRQLQELKLDGVLITSPENRLYLSGFSGSAGALLISDSETYLLTDFRYWEQAALEAADFELAKQGPSFWSSLADLIKDLKWQRIGFEADNLNFQDYQTIINLGLSGTDWQPLTGLVAKQRAVKDEDEIGLIARAAEITDLALAATLQRIKPGMREREVALEFDYQLRINGASGSAFETIVASGSHSSFPHGAPDAEKIITPGDLIIIDGGAVFQGYHADLTRTAVLGKADVKQKEVYKIVLQAQEAAISILKGRSNWE